MNQETYNDIEAESTKRFRDLLESTLDSAAEDMNKRAARKVEEVLSEYSESGRVLKLTDEEERMLRCFRRFKMTNHKPGAIFKWQTHPEAGIAVVAGDDQALIVDPQDANG